MDISIFLAKALGIYLIFISIAFIIQEKRLKDLMINMMSNPGLMVVSGFVALIVGILLIVSHNLWVKDWRVLITIVGWLAFLKGASIILVPEGMVRISTQWIQNKFLYYVTFLLVFIVGVILIYHGDIQYV